MTMLYRRPEIIITLDLNLNILINIAAKFLINTKYVRTAQSTYDMILDYDHFFFLKLVRR